MVNNPPIHPRRQLIRARTGAGSLRLRTRARSGPVSLRLGLSAFWLLAGLLLPVAGVAGVVWLLVPLGNVGAVMAVALADVVVVFAAAVAAARDAGLAAPGIALCLAMTWVVLAVGYIALTTAGG